MRILLHFNSCQVWSTNGKNSSPLIMKKMNNEAAIGSLGENEDDVGLIAI